MRTGMIQTFQAMGLYRGKFYWFLRRLYMSILTSKHFQKTSEFKPQICVKLQKMLTLCILAQF